MTIELLKSNIERMKEIIREGYIFTNHLTTIENLEAKQGTMIESKEKVLLTDAISSLIIQLRILNKSVPDLIKNIGFYKKLEKKPVEEKPAAKLIQVKYNHLDKDQSVSLVISDEDKKEFLENLSKSNLSINQLKRKYSVEKSTVTDFGKPNAYAKSSNRLFKNLSNRLISEGYFMSLNRNLRKINSPFVIGTYISMILMTVMITFFISIILLIMLMFFNIGPTFPFFSVLPSETNLLIRFAKTLWIIFIIPIGTGLLMYFYPNSEARSLGKKIEQELPFVTIHMSAVATSGVEPISIFKIIIRNEEYIYTNTQLKKLVNLINFHGKDLVTALKETARSSPSPKLRELLEGLATAINSGGSLKDYLAKRAENLLFDYKIERERYTKTSETFMDIYISVVIAAPMILLMLFVIMGSTGTLSSLLGFGIEAISVLIILAIALLNIGFLVLLRLKQPTM
ncbi:Type II secretion system (T2SS), protein F [uncultured archaeon]|nr:Type II secretion system (T2SS), protein F [uncultured archaeon]